MERFSPKVWTLGLKIGAIYVQRGINNFDDWSAKMAESCGTKIEPWLSAIWETLCNIPEGSKFNDKQILALADRIGGLYSHGTTNLYGIAKAIEGDIGAENTAKLFPMIQATYRGIKRYFDDLKRKAPPAVKTKTIASGVCGENLTWILDDKGTLTISGKGAMENFNGGRSRSKETSPPWYDSRTYVKKIIVNDGVTTIGNYAFSDCNNLTDVRLSNSLAKIGESAFYYCWHLTGVNIPESVKTIGACAFSGCHSFSWVIIPESIVDIGAWSFNACEGLKIVTIPASVTKIGEWIFVACFLKEIHYPAGRGFEKNLSQGNNAKLIPYEVAPPIIEEGTRGTCGENLTWTLDDDGTLTISGTGEMENYVYDSYSKSANTPWWAYRDKIEKIIIYNGVTSIGAGAFWFCESLKEIKIPDSVTEIGDSAFRVCKGLKEIKIPDGVTTIGAGAFCVCETLREIKIPDSVTSIGDWAFGACKSLREIKIPDGIMSIGELAFEECSSLREIIIPDGITSIGDSAFDECKSLTEIKIPAGVTEIGDRAFSNCESLTEIKIPVGVTKIGEWTFSFCYNLTKIKISDSTTTIGEKAFVWCKSLTSVKIPDGVTTIGKEAFSGCYNLKAIYYPAGRGFEENLSQGNNAKLIPYDVAPSAIKAGTRGICGKNLIWTLDDDGTLTISGTGEMKSYPQVQNLPWFNYRERIKNVFIDFGVTSVSERVFWNCKSLSKITISDSVVSIGERTFWSCNSLTEVNIPESVASIGDAPFKGCSSLKKIYYPSGRDFKKFLSAGNKAKLVPY